MKLKKSRKACDRFHYPASYWQWLWILFFAVGMLGLGAQEAKAFVTSVYDDVNAPGNKLTVTFGLRPQDGTLVNDLEIQCEPSDVNGNFTTPTPNWSIGPIISRSDTNVPGKIKYYLTLTRNPSIATEIVIIRHLDTGNKRGTRGRLHTTLNGNLIGEDSSGPSFLRRQRTDLPALIKLDFNSTGDNNDVNKQDGFTPFIIVQKISPDSLECANTAYSGSEDVNGQAGVVVELSSNLGSTGYLDSRCLRDEVGGVLTPYPYDDVYRDFIFGGGIPPTGVTFTIWGLGAGRDCNIVLYSFDTKVEPSRRADWTANGQYIFTADFNGNNTSYLPTNEDGYAFPGKATADKFGRIILKSRQDPCSPVNEAFVYVNALKVVATGDKVEPKYAQCPRPPDGKDDVPVNAVLKWRKGAGVATHDLYFGTDPYLGDTFSVDVNEGGKVANGNGSEPCFPNWYYYPISGWWNVWFYNAPYNEEHWKEIWIDLTVEPIYEANHADVNIIAGGSTGAWAADPNGSVRPPLPSDVTAVTEPLYIDRTEPNRYYNNDLNGSQVVHLHIIIEDYNPEWVFVDVCGVNFRIVGGCIRHVCHGGGELIYARNLLPDANVYDPYGDTVLNLDTTYYWSVDENTPPNIWQGEVWSFKTLPYYVAEDFNEYASNDELEEVWNDWWVTYTGAAVYLQMGVTDANFVRPKGDKSSNSMMYDYRPYYMWQGTPYYTYYSEAYADIADLGIDPDWLGMGAKLLTLWFYGQADNDANEQMYLTLTDGDDVSATVIYDGDMDDVKKTEWQEWVIVLTDFTNVNLSDISRITIGFGDEVEGPGSGLGTVYFEDIRLYTTRCVLAKRSADFAKVDFAPGGLPAGDCVIDEREVQLLANTWLSTDSTHDTNNPDRIGGPGGLVAYYPFNEGDGNRTYNLAPSPHPNSTPARLSPSLYPDREQPVTWLTPGLIIENIGMPEPNSAVHFNGLSGERISCGQWAPTLRTGALTASIWAKWLGPHLDRDKCQGLISMRRGWNETATGTYFMFECDTIPGPRGSFTLRQRNGDYACYSAGNILDGFIGQWIHLAATVDGNTNADPNGYYASRCRLYLNGALVQTGVFGFGKGDPNQIEMTIGQISDVNEQGTESFMGDLDEARIYNRALDANEIAYLADTTPTDGKLASPVPSAAELYWVGEGPGQKKINFKDFTIVAEKWLKEEMWPRP